MSELEWYFVDAETHYSSDYSLTHMDPCSYILDPRFEAICLGTIKGIDGTPTIVDGPDIPAWLASLPSNVALVSHNALFDMSILSWRYNYVPSLIVDTLSMARTLLRHKLKSMSLASIASYYGLEKGTYVQDVKGMTRADIIANGMWEGFTEYCMNDAVLCRRVFCALMQDLPPEEFILQDIIARTAVVPTLRLDMDVLAENLQQVQHDKQILFMKAMFAGLRDKTQLMSNPQFGELLRSMGVNPPTTISKVTGLTTFSFAKSNPEFLELLDHEDPKVATLVEARLEFKSTIEETRTERMLNIGRLDFPHHGGTGTMPIPLIIGAAHTHRLGGGWKLNPQNWKRGGLIRKSIRAPAGYRLITADKRQIEARMNAWFCEQEDLIEAFRQDRDVYSDFATEIYGYPVSKNDHPTQRFVGKTGILQLGYQAWWPKFQTSVWLLSYDGVNEPVSLSDDEAREIVTMYRRKYFRIANMWKWLPQRFGALAGVDAPFEYKCVRFEHGRVMGPTGLPMFYENLRFVNGDWLFDFGGAEHKLYGGKALENCWSQDTMVLTEEGWLPIQDVDDRRVWDGIEWVSHGGVISRGEQQVICVDGAWCTPDHEILTTEGWRSASSCEGHHREQARLPDLPWVQRIGWPEISVVDPLRLRRHKADGCQGFREEPIVRMREVEAAQQGSYTARHVDASGLLGLALDDRPMSAADTSGMEELWWAGHHGSRPMADVREFLGGYGSDVPQGTDHRAYGQQQRVREGELRLGYPCNPEPQQTRQREYPDPVGSHDSCRSSTTGRDRHNDTALPPESRRAMVYDILDAGKRARFIIASESGPLIVHNCIQFLSRINTMSDAVRLKKPLDDYSSRLVHTAHDELVYLCPESYVEPVTDLIRTEMTRVPDWAPGLPLAVDIGVGDTYGASK